MVKNDSNSYMYERLNDDLKLCSFSENIKLGFLFFLGAGIQNFINLKCSIFHKLREEKNDELAVLMHDCINSYSHPTGDFEQAFSTGKTNIGEIEIINLLYTHAHIAINVLGESNQDIKDQFRNIHPTIPVKVIRGEIVDDFVQNFDVDWTIYRIEDKMCLNIFYVLQEELFERIGSYINNSGMTYKQAYEAGFAFFVLMSNFDLKGTKFLIDTVINFLSPMFSSLFTYPILNSANIEALKYNHIFSHNFQYFSASADPVIGIPVHKYHQITFYNYQSSEFKNEWSFEMENDVDIATKLFNSACQIRNTDLLSEQDNYLNIDGFAFPNLKGRCLNFDDFRWEIESGIFNKYGIRAPRYEEQNGWTNNGDFMQFCAILFFETCAHALVLKELKGE